MADSEIPSEKTEENKDHPSENERESGNHDQCGQSSDIRTLIDAQSRQSEADREERRRQDRRKSFREWATIILLFLAFGATVIQAIIFHGQLDEMRKVYGPIKDSADAAKNSVDISRIALISTQRAYVSANIESIPVTEKDGALKGFAFSIRWQNKGPTRAINLQNFVMIKRFEPDVPDNFDFTTPPGHGFEGQISVIIDPNSDVHSSNALIPLSNIEFATNNAGITYLWGAPFIMIFSKKPNCTTFMFASEL